MARTKKETQAMIRLAGLRTERKFFGPRGVFAKAGHLKRRASGNPKGSKWEPPRPWDTIAESTSTRDQFMLSGDGNVYARTLSGWVNHGTLEEFTAHALAHWKPLRWIKKNDGHTAWPVLLDYVQNEGWKPLGKKNVQAFGRTVGSLYQVLQKEAQEWRVLYRTFLTAAASPAISLGTYDTVDRAMIAANRQASDWLGKATKNPITVVGNPPTRINTTIAGVLYNRCVEIRAEKTGNSSLRGLYYHPFLERSKVMVLALDNGDILIHSSVGEHLWKLD